MAHITGTSGDDLIHIAGDGEDSQFPNPPYNELAQATDLILGPGPDNGQMVIQSGDDVISAGDGDDVIFSGHGNDVISAGDGNDTIVAGGAVVFDPDGNDGDGFTVTGGGRLSGGNGDDDITAGYNTSIDGGAGLDTVHLDFTGDTEHNAAHTLIAFFNQQGVTVNLGDAATGTVSIAVGGLGDMVTTLTHVDAFDITFGAGDDTVTGGTHDDVLYGDAYNLIGVTHEGGNDVIHGGAGNDYINGEPGLDMLYGDAGNDTLDGGQARGAFEDFMSDDLHGGDGNDTLHGGEGDLFDGGAGTDVAYINLASSNFSYKINLNSATGNSLYDFGDSAALGTLYNQQNDTVITHGTQTESVTHFAELDLGSGNDRVSGDASRIDVLTTGDGNDVVSLTGTMQESAFLDGGAGIDTLTLTGDYSTPFFLDFNSVKNFEHLNLGAGFNYDFVLGIGGADITRLDASALGASNTLTLDATRGAYADAVIVGGAGNDTFDFGTQLQRTQHIDGGAGNDTLVLDGNFAFTFGTGVTNVETILLEPGGASYKLATTNDNIGGGKPVTIDGSQLGSDGNSGTLQFNGAAEVSGHFIILGGAGADRLVGGHASDTLNGGLGADILTGTGGGDTFAYASAADSNSTSIDRIEGFNASSDKLDLWFTVNAVVAPINGGTVSALHTLADAAHLGSHDALLFTASDGTTYLVVDSNGTAGYQTGQDLLIRLDAATHLDALSTSTFT